MLKKIFLLNCLFFGAQSVYGLHAADVNLVSEYQIKRGWFVVSDVGLFATLGGFKDSIHTSTPVRTPVLFSLIQPQIGVAIGYDALNWLSVGVKLGQGYVSGAARTSDLKSPTSYGLLFIDAVLFASREVYRRLVLSGQIFAGLVIMTPAVMPDARRFGADLGLGVGFKYHTLLNGLFVGVDLNTRASLLPETSLGNFPGIISFSLVPKVGYVF